MKLVAGEQLFITAYIIQEDMLNLKMVALWLNMKRWLIESQCGTLQLKDK
jgi:hypothetical protein